jgi:hypothetical protein
MMSLLFNQATSLYKPGWLAVIAAVFVASGGSRPWAAAVRESPKQAPGTSAAFF